MQIFTSLRDRIEASRDWQRPVSGDESKPSQRRDLSLGALSQGKLGELFGADLRSLAVLRIVLGCLVLMDLAGRLPNLRIHYTDEGVLPRELLLADLNDWRWSLNLISGTYFVQVVLFLLAAVAATFLILGYRTRLMSILVWVMVVSIQVRNPLVSSGADTLLRVLLFWSMLLPLGAHWAIDSQRPASQRSLSMRFLSFGTIGIFMQIAFMYWFTAALKSSPIWLSEGTALYYATGAEQITRPFGEFLHQFPALLKLLTHASLGLEVVAPILLFFPIFTGPVRTFAVASIMAFHLGIFVVMDVGIFPWTSSLAMVCFLPGWFWDSALPKAQAVPRERFASFRRVQDVATGPVHAFWNGLRGGGHAGALARFSSSEDGPGAIGHEYAEGTSAQASEPPAVVTGPPSSDGKPRVLESSWLTNLFAAFCLIFVFGWNMASVSAFTMPGESRPVAYGLGLYQQWNMFAPRPPRATIWYVVRGVLRDGQEVNLLTPIIYDDLNMVSQLSWEQPENIVGDYYKDKYWRKYLESIGVDGDKDNQREFAAYTCRTWNGHYGGDVELESVQIVRLSQRTLPGDQDPPVTRTIAGAYNCT